MSEKSAVYECVDREHDAWRCRACGYIENFEADGPTENGWHFCPGCGREIIVEVVNPCPFDNDNCMCQFCETPCNNGLNCSDCAHEGKAVHDVFLCTGFDGSVKQYVANWKRKQMEERAGVTVISPAVTPEGLKKADYMRICFAMLESADTAVFLPDWEGSPGAQLEKHWCEYVGKKMVFLMEGAE